MRLRLQRCALALLLPAAGALLHPPRASACECVEHSVSGAKKHSRAVFVGTVLEVDGDWVARLAVQKLWKGDNVPEFRVHVGYGLCTSGMEAGKTYLVYAYWDEERHRLSTDHCVRTRPVAETDDLKKLGRPRVIRSVREMKND